MEISNKLGSKTLLIAVVENGDSVLMRKKPAGMPYRETWYLFGCERLEGQDDQVTLTEYLKQSTGIVVYSIVQVSTATETKVDTDGLAKNFNYINFTCLLKSGLPHVPEGAERVEWVPKKNLSEYDIVPPSRDLFKKLGYLN